MAESEA